MTTTTVPFLDSIAIERQRRLDGRTIPDPHARVLWRRALDLQSSRDRDALDEALRYALGIPYRHEGLTSEIYATHPVRVAAMALLVAGSRGVEAGVVGLLHNVLEVSDIGADEIRSRFGERVASQVQCLTVERARQWDADYKRDYYASLLAGPTSARIVKVLDKLDNLFVLGLNPDADMKTKYAREIQEHVVPMADRDIPAVGQYLRALLNETILVERLGLTAA